jgi:hypothetical protein
MYTQAMLYFIPNNKGAERDDSMSTTLNPTSEHIKEINVIERDTNEYKLFMKSDQLSAASSSSFSSSCSPTASASPRGSFELMPGSPELPLEGGLYIGYGAMVICPSGR